MVRACFLLSLAFPALAQTQGAAQGDPLQALLAEVHQLRIDLQATTVTSQRVQILLYRVQLQQASTARAIARADEAHSRLADAQRQHARATSELQQTQDAANTATDPEKAKGLQAQAGELKRQVEMWSADEQQRQVKDSEAESQLHAEQAKLDELQDTLDRLDKALANLAKQP